MAKRFTDSELWDKEWFMKLPCRLKCLVKFVRDKCDLSGVWSPNWSIANAYVGEPVSEEELLKIDGGNQFQKTAGGKIFCIGFIEFQYGKLSEKSPVHRKVLSILNSHKIPYKYPINRVQEEDKDKEEAKVKDKEKEKDGEETEIILPFDSEVFNSAWAAWKEYKAKEKKFTYKSPISEQIALKRLGEISGNNENKALEIIETSIANGWEGLFELKVNQNAKHVTTKADTNATIASAQKFFRESGIGRTGN